MTERLYYGDSFLTKFEARVVAADGPRVYLDRTAFYPSSGGQPFDTGTLGGVPVIEVVDEESRIAHVLTRPLPEGIAVAGVVDWPRRHDHMQQHTGQHLLSAVLDETFGFATVSFHLGAETSTIELATPSITADQVTAGEQRANEVVWENRPVSVSYEDSAAAVNLRKASDRAGTLRIVSIGGLDRSACGGTHVAATGAIGAIQIRRLEKIRGNVRLEFVCGRRAMTAARRDYDALSEAARLFSAPIEQVPALVKAQTERMTAAEKARKKLAMEVAGYEGRQLHASTGPGVDGLRRAVRRIAKGAIDDDLRVTAQAFTGAGKAVFVALIEEAPSVLLAASADSGVNAGEILKSLLAANGGRGGGNPGLAQGTLPSREALDKLAASLSL